jgi:formylglycine-generating enzyme required for sulfatase activity
MGPARAEKDAGTIAQPRFVQLPRATFLMGTDDANGFPDDLEGPVRPTDVDPFSIAETAVTNDQFAAFVAAAGYQTEAERFGWSFVFHLLVEPGSRQHVMDAHVPGVTWWLAVRGADWRHPDGPTSDLSGRGDHPVVHVSHHDTVAFCRWSDTRLPTETEWEYAARGGLEQARYPWGDELMPAGQHRCNIWQGHFPTVNSGEDGWIGTAPATAFPPNGFGLYNVAGNVWEICADPWREPEGNASQDEVVIRGGSYLCHDSYCNRYRVAARSRATRDSSTGNTGFRVARS